MIGWFEKNNILSWIITLLIAVFIFYISSQSFPNGSPGPSWNFKPYLYHILIFFLLSFFLSISLSKGLSNYKIFVFIAILIGLAYGIFDELHQFFVPGRECAIDDALIDGVGSLSAGILYLLRIKK